MAYFKQDDFITEILSESRSSSGQIVQCHAADVNIAFMHLPVGMSYVE